MQQHQHCVFYYPISLNEKEMEKWLLFIDGSVNTGTKFGFGAYLLIKESKRELESLKAHIKTKRFENTSSTKLELQTLLWALEEIQVKEHKVIIYTDAQNIIGLHNRRERLEKSDYYTTPTKRLNNFELYEEFYKITDKLNCEFRQLTGHKKSDQKDFVDKLFTLVDRAARKALRNENKK